METIKRMEATLRLIGTVSDGHLKMIWACAIVRMMALTAALSFLNLALKFKS